MNELSDLSDATSTEANFSDILYILYIFSFLITSALLYKLRKFIARFIQYIDDFNQLFCC